MNYPSAATHIMILTGEPSGDVHAADLVRRIKAANPQIYFSGIGGSQLNKEKIDLFYDIKHLSAMGLTDVIAQFGKIKKAFSIFKQKISRHPPDLVILVDYPGFNLRAAQFIKQHSNIPILYYIAPKVWAWNKSRLKKMKKCIDHVALILPFEKKIYDRAGIPATYVGNPLMDHYSNPNRLQISTNTHQRQITIGLLPGSRKSEINQLLPVMIQSAEKISRDNKNIRFIISKADAIEEHLIQNHLCVSKYPELFHIEMQGVHHIFEQCDFLIAASGTVTLEAALTCIPTIIIYKVSALTYMLGRRLVKLDYVGLANIIVNNEVMPELLQEKANPDQIHQKTLEMLDRLPGYQKKLRAVRQLLGPPGAAQKTAAIALHMLHQKNIDL